MVHKPEIIQHFGFNVDAVDCLYVVEDKGIVIVITDLKRLIIWKPDYNGKYTPSISNEVPVRCASVFCVESSQKNELVLGQQNGMISIISLSISYQHIIHIKTIKAHFGNKPVICMKYCSELNALFSLSRDNTLVWTNITSAKKVAQITTLPSTSLLELDEHNKLLYSVAGNRIQRFKVCPEEINKIIPKPDIPHNYPQIICLMTYLPKYSSLALGCKSGEIHVFFGEDYHELFALYQHEREILLIGSTSNDRIISLSIDCMIVVWDFTARRLPIAQWRLDNSCSDCHVPFYWNIVSMVNSKKLGVPRHHCRMCGRSLCDRHSSFNATSPTHGLEISVRLCELCFGIAKKSETSPLCHCYHLNHSPKIATMDLSKCQIFIWAEHKPIFQIDLRDCLN